MNILKKISSNVSETIEVLLAMGKALLGQKNTLSSNVMSSKKQPTPHGKDHFSFMGGVDRHVNLSMYVKRNNNKNMGLGD